MKLFWIGSGTDIKFLITKQKTNRQQFVFILGYRVVLQSQNKGIRLLLFTDLYYL